MYSLINFDIWTVFIHSTSDIKYVRIFFPSYQPILQFPRYLLGVSQFNSILTQLRINIEPHRWRAQPHRTAPMSDASHKSHAAPCTSHLLTGSQFKEFPQPPQVWSFARMAHRIQQDILFTITVFLHKGYKMNSQMMRYMGWGPEGSGAQQLV